MEFRLKQLRDAVAADAVGRVKEVQYYLDEIEKRAEEMCKGERLHHEGKLPKRVCHCDTKVNNMMFDEEGKVLCVIDLDTVMPNFIFLISAISFVLQPIQVPRMMRIWIM